MLKMPSSFGFGHLVVQLVQLLKTGSFTSTICVRLEAYPAVDCPVQM